MAWPDTSSFDALEVSTVTFDLGESLQVARTGGGEVIPATLGPRLWTGEITLAAGRASTVAAANARLSRLRDAGASFLIFDPAHAYPAKDPGGTILGSATPTISWLDPGGRTLAMIGLPPGYQMTAGDYVAWTYGSDPLRYALHQLVEDGTANGSGTTPAVEVIPPIRAGATVNAPVTLVKARCKAVLVPGSVQLGVGGPGPTAQGARFEFMQTLR